MPRTVFDLSFISSLPYYYLFLAVLLVTLGITWWMTNSRMGFYLRAIKDSERAARSLGAPASRTKLYAFMLSAGLTSVAGALYAMMFGFVDPESGLGIHRRGPVELGVQWRGPARSRTSSCASAHPG